MRRPDSARSALSAVGGTLLFAAALALSLPGVRAVRAEAPPADAPMCRADEPSTVPSSMERLSLAVRRAADRDARGAGGQGVRVVNLNTRGYNYDSGTEGLGADAAVLLREIRLRHGLRPAPPPGR